jgi:hypothetical protein
MQQHPAGTIFHHSAWARVLQDRYGASPTYYAKENGNGEIYGNRAVFSFPARRAFSPMRMTSLCSAAR